MRPLAGLGAKNPDLARRAEAGLVELGPAAEYELPKALTHPSVQVRRVVVRLLGRQKGSACVLELLYQGNGKFRAKVGLR